MGNAMHERSQSNYYYMFPAVRGMQAGREFYIATCPLLTIPKIFSFDEEEVPPELRAQRSLNKARIPDMVRYLLDNPDNYIFSALTASVAVDVHFEALNDAGWCGKTKQYALYKVGGFFYSYCECVNITLFFYGIFH